MLKLNRNQTMEIAGKIAILFAVGVQLTSIADRQAEKVNAEIAVQQTAAHVTITDTPILMLHTQLQTLDAEAKILKLL